MSNESKAELEEYLARSQARLRVLLELSLRGGDEAHLARSEIPELRKKIATLIGRVALSDRQVDA